MKTMTRTMRLAVGTAAMLALMSSAAQARADARSRAVSGRARS